MEQFNEGARLESTMMCHFQKSQNPLGHCRLLGRRQFSEPNREMLFGGQASSLSRPAGFQSAEFVSSAHALFQHRRNQRSVGCKRRSHDQDFMGLKIRNIRVAKSPQQFIPQHLHLPTRSKTGMHPQAQIMLLQLWTRLIQIPDVALDPVKDRKPRRFPGVGLGPAGVLFVQLTQQPESANRLSTHRNQERMSIAHLDRFRIRILRDLRAGSLQVVQIPKRRQRHINLYLASGLLQDPKDPHQQRIQSPSADHKKNRKNLFKNIAGRDIIPDVPILLGGDIIPDVIPRAQRKEFLLQLLQAHHRRFLANPPLYLAPDFPLPLFILRGRLGDVIPIPAFNQIRPVMGVLIKLIGNQSRQGQAIPRGRILNPQGACVIRNKRQQLPGQGALRPRVLLCRTECRRVKAFQKIPRHQEFKSHAASR